MTRLLIALLIAQSIGCQFILLTFFAIWKNFPKKIHHNVDLNR